MIKPLLSIVLVCLAFAGHAQDFRPAHWKTPRKTKDPQVFEATQNGTDFYLVYEDAAECAERFVKDAKLNRWDEAQQQVERSKIPAAGYLRASWARRGLSAASADNFVFLIEAPDGKELLRIKPEPTIARPFSYGGVTVYSEVAFIPLNAPLPDGATVYVIESSAQKRYEFIIHP